MSNKSTDTPSVFKRRLGRRQIIKGGAAGTIALAGGATIFAPWVSRAVAASGSITIGSFQDNAMAPFRDYFVKKFASETGITVNYN